MIKQDNYLYLRQDLPNVKERKAYCQKFITNTIKRTKESQLFFPIPIRIQPWRKTKYILFFRSIVVDNNTAGVLYPLISKKLGLNKGQGLFLICDDTLLNFTTDLKSLYQKKKNQDGFLYVSYAETNPF